MRPWEANVIASEAKQQGTRDVIAIRRGGEATTQIIIFTGDDFSWRNRRFDHTLIISYANRFQKSN